MLENKGQKRTHEYADAQNGIKLKEVSRLYPSDFKPEFDLVVAAGGASVTITPTNGNLDNGLESYKAVIYDDNGNEAFGALDLALPANPIVINTTVLDANKLWTLQFTASRKGAGDVCSASECLEIDITTGQIAAGLTKKVRLPFFTYEAVDVDRVIASISVNGQSVVPAGDTIGDVQAAIEAALDLADAAYTVVTVADGAVGTFTITIEGAVDQKLIIEAVDGVAATIPIALK